MQPGDPTIGWKVRISAVLAARVDLALWDKTLQKPRYGARRELIEGLLQEWLLSRTPEDAREELKKELRNA